MTIDRFTKEMLYHASLAPFKKMLSEGLITAEDYAIIDTILCKKYQPMFGGNIAENIVDIMPEQR